MSAQLVLVNANLRTKKEFVGTGSVQGTGSAVAYGLVLQVCTIPTVPVRKCVVGEHFGQGLVRTRTGASSIGTNLGVDPLGEGHRKSADGVNPSVSEQRFVDVERPMSAYRCLDEGLVPSRPLRSLFSCHALCTLKFALMGQTLSLRMRIPLLFASWYKVFLGMTSLKVN